MFKYEPTVKDMTDAYTVAYGDTGVYALAAAMFANLPEETIERLYAQALQGVYALVGAMFANLPEETIERLYAQALQATREDLAKKGLL